MEKRTIETSIYLKRWCLVAFLDIHYGPEHQCSLGQWRPVAFPDIHYGLEHQYSLGPWKLALRADAAVDLPRHLGMTC